MKRFLSIILILGLLCLIGCKQEIAQSQGTPCYYFVATPTYDLGSTSISPEYRRDVPQDSLTQALKIYLSGPISSDMQSPFPDGLKIISAKQEDRTVYLILSAQLADLSGMQLTIACCCLTLTTLALTDAEQVQISTIGGLLNGQRSITMDKNTLLLLDTAGQEE